MKFLIAFAILAVAVPAAMSAPQYVFRSDILDHSLYSPFYRSSLYAHHYPILARTIPEVVAAEPIAKSTIVAGPSGTITQHENLASPLSRTILAPHALSYAEAPFVRSVFADSVVSPLSKSTVVAGPSGTITEHERLDTPFARSAYWV